MKSRRHRSPRADTMKCVTVGGVFKRVSNDEAEMLVAGGGKYCSKSVYKARKK
jgi:hypothetical protein